MSSIYYAVAIVVVIVSIAIACGIKNDGCICGCLPVCLCSDGCKCKCCNRVAEKMTPSPAYHEVEKGMREDLPDHVETSLLRRTTQFKEFQDVDMLRGAGSGFEDAKEF